MIQLGIIEDNLAIVATMTEFFNLDSDIRLAGVATHVDAFFEQVPAGVDVLLLDLNLPYKNGMDCIGEICSRYPGISIIIHSVSADYDSIFKCLCGGAHSYLIKGESLATIKETVINTYKGGSQMSIQIARKVVEYFSRQRPNNQFGNDQRLNARETQVVNLIVNGKSYKIVADELGISINTVRTYIKSIYKKLNINSNMELANIYLRKKD